MAAATFQQHAAAAVVDLIVLEEEAGDFDNSRQTLAPKDTPDTPYTSHEAYISHTPRPSTTTCLSHTPPSWTHNPADLIHLGSLDATLRVDWPSGPPQQDYPPHDFLLSGYGYDPLRPT